MIKWLNFFCLIILLTNNCTMSKERQIKKKIVFKGLVIKLYSIPRGELIKQRNIEAFDDKMNLLWIIEEPTKDIYYFDMQIDEENHFLEADSGTGEKYEINISNGRIIRSSFIK